MLRNIVYVILITSAFITSLLVYPETKRPIVKAPNRECPLNLPDEGLIETAPLGIYYSVDFDNEDEIMYCVYDIETNI